MCLIHQMLNIMAIQVSSGRPLDELIYKVDIILHTPSVRSYHQWNNNKNNSSSMLHAVGVYYNSVCHTQHAPLDVSTNVL